MDKVYFNKDYYGCWWLKELTDIYSFKSVNFETKEEVETILTWTRNIDLSEYDDKIVRMYDVEIEEVKYLFLMRKQDSIYIIESESPQQLEKLINNHNIFFVGETMNS
jgi:hypothetical protein